MRFVLHLQDWWCVGKCKTSFPVNKLWLIYLPPSLWPLTIKCKCESFESRSLLLNTSYQICLQNVETDYLEMLAKWWKPIRVLVKYKAKDKRSLNDWFPVINLMFCLRCNHFQKFAEFSLSLAIFWSDYFCQATLFPPVANRPIVSGSLLGVLSAGVGCVYKWFVPWGFSLCS